MDPSPQCGPARHRRPASLDSEVLRRYLEKVVQQAKRDSRRPGSRGQQPDQGPQTATGEESLRRPDHVSASQGETWRTSGRRLTFNGSGGLGRKGVREVSLGSWTSTHDRCVITGRPGSGKTTCIRFLSFCHARQGLVPEQLPLERLRHWSGEWLMPIVVELRYFARQLPREIEPRSLWDFFKRTTLQGNGLENLEPALAAAAANGRALVIFEGLDEVPTGAQRLLVHQAIREFAECPQFKASRIVVTLWNGARLSRRSRAPRIPGSPARGLQPQQESEPTRAWYRAHAPLRNLTDTDAARKADDLHEAIQEPALAAQAGVPMMLTVMANVHTKNNKLPRDRAVVYDQMVRILIDNWDNARLGDSAPLRRLLDGAKKTENDLLQLRRLAYEAHSSRRNLDGSLDGCADLSKHGPNRLLRAIPHLLRQPRSRGGVSRSH